MNVPYQIIKTNRKTVAIQIKPSGEVVVRCPRRMAQKEIHAFVDSKAAWIESHLSQMSREPVVKLTGMELEKLRDRTGFLVNDRVKFYAPIVGVTYNRVTIRIQHTRWGSCSSKGNLNFNALLALVPPEVLDYVVVHELCHRIELNHSDRFWYEVKRVLPDYKQRQIWLKEQGCHLMARL